VCIDPTAIWAPTRCSLCHPVHSTCPVPHLLSQTTSCSQLCSTSFPLCKCHADLVGRKVQQEVGGTVERFSGLNVKSLGPPGCNSCRNTFGTTYNHSLAYGTLVSSAGHVWHTQGTPAVMPFNGAPAHKNRALPPLQHTRDPSFSFNTQHHLAGCSPEHGVPRHTTGIVQGELLHLLKQQTHEQSGSAGPP